MKALIIVSLLGVAAMMLEALRLKRYVMMVTVAGLIAALVTIAGEWNSGLSYFSDMVHYDNQALAFSALIVSITLLWLFLGRSMFWSPDPRSDQASILLFVSAGALAMAGAADMTMFFIGLEILSISVYILAASNKRDLRSNEAGMKYFLLGAFSTGFLLLGVALIYGATGSFHFENIAASLAGMGTGHPLIVQAGVLLILTGLLFKVSAVPFQFWTPDVYEGAPTPVTAFMATLVKTAAFVALYRLFSSCFSSLHGMWGPVVAVLSALTMLVGNILAVSQYSIKRMLAYSSIAHAGYLLMAIAVMNELTAGSILYYAAAYSIGSLGVFALVLPLSIRGDERIDALKGLSSRNPLAAAALAVLVFSMAGIPPMAGFFAKYSVFLGAADAGMVWLVLAGILSSLIGVYYYFRMIHAAYSPAEEGSEGFSPDRYAVMMIVLAAVLSLVLGIVPSLLQGLI